MRTNRPNRSAKFSTRLLPHLARASTCIGLAAALGSECAHGDQAIWVALGSTEHVRRVQLGNLLTRPGSIFNVNALASSDDSFANWMTPTTPGGTTGTSSSAAFFRVSDLEHAVIADDLHESRKVFWHDDALPQAATGERPVFKSLRITTRGDLTIVGRGNFGPTEWLIRDPQASGTHVIDGYAFAFNTWIGGSGSLMLNAGAGGQRLTKSGPGTLILNPSDYSSNGSRKFAWWPGVNIYDGTLALWGTGEQYLISSDGEAIRIGAEYGGVDYPPSSIPPASWSPFSIPPVPPVKQPRALIQADNVVAPGDIVKMGHNSTLQFEAPDPISFLGSVVSDVIGNDNTIVCKGQTLEAVTFAPSSLDSFRGTFRIEGGAARLQAPPNGLVAFNLAAPAFPTEAVLELKVTDAPYSFANSISGLGRVLKWGSQSLTFSATTSGFAGDFVIQEGQLTLPSNAQADTLRNAVVVNGPASILNQQANNAIADNTLVSLDDSARWLLNGRTDTIARLKLVNNARLELAGGTLTLADGTLDIVHTPGASTSAIIQGPGTLASTAPLTIDTYFSQAPYALDIQATLSAPSVLLTGLGTVRLGGSGAAGPGITVQGGELRLRRTNVAATAGAITIGDASSGLPVAPFASVVLEAADQLPDNRALTMNRQGSLNLNGFTDTIGALIVNGSGPFTIDANAGELVLAGDATFTGAGATTITGPLNMLAGARSFTINSGSTLLLAGSAYSGTINKLGSGALRLDALDGYFTLNNSGFNTSVGAGSVGGLTGTGSVRIDTALAVNTPVNVSTAFSGAINGAGSFTKSGAGRLELNSGAINNYTGLTRIDGGTLFLNRFPGTTVIPGNLTIASGGTLLYAGGAINQIADTADIIIESGGTMDLAGQTDTVRNLTVIGACRTDTANGSALGAITATQNISVLAGTLDGAVGGGALNVNLGRAHIRGAVSSASLGLAGSTLAVGGFPGLDQLTISGAFSLPNPNAVIECSVGSPTDPALIRALGSLSYPLFGTATVRVIQNTPVPFGTSFRLIDFGAGSSSPNFSKYALSSPSGSGRGRLVLSNRMLSYVVAQNPCPADANGNGVQDIDDIFVFLNIWFSGSPGADFDLSGTQTLDDVFIFINAWFRAC
jgi:autotransporter-associated beta strand protein